MVYKEFDGMGFEEIQIVQNVISVRLKELHREGMDTIWAGDEVEIRTIEGPVKATVVEINDDSVVLETEFDNVTLHPLNILPKK